MRKTRSLHPDCEMMEDRLVMSTDPGHGAFPGFALIDLAKPKPAAPSFTATPISTTQVTLSWTKVSGASRYLIEESVGGKWVQLVSEGKNTTTFTKSGLAPNTTYTFDVVYVKGGRKFQEAPKAATTQPLSELLSGHNGTTDPTTENFVASSFAGSGTVGPATGEVLSAWEVTSDTPTAQVGYTDSRPLSASQQAEIASQGFTVTLVARVDRNGVAPAYDQYPAFIGGVSVGMGSVRWEIDLGINSKGDTVVIPPTTVGYGSQPGVVVDTGPTYTLSDSGYHTYQLYYSPATSSASLYIDGKLVLSGYTGETAYVGNWRLQWWALNGGQGFYNQVKLETGYDIV